MPKENKHGLFRRIPDDIRRQVRRRCGFGCLLCRQAPVQYDHFEPEWVDAKQHDPAGIVLLCPSCHVKRGAGIVSINQIHEALKRAESGTLGPVRYEFNQAMPEQTKWRMRMGTFDFVEGARFEVNGATILSVAGDKELGTLLNATFTNEHGEVIAELEDNAFELEAAKLVDFRCLKNSFEVRDSYGTKALVATIDAADGLVDIRKVNIRFGPFRIFYAGHGECEIQARRDGKWMKHIPFDGRVELAGLTRLHTMAPTDKGATPFMMTFDSVKMEELQKRFPPSKPEDAKG